MQKDEHIVSYTAEELATMRSMGQSETDWSKVDSMTREQLEAAIAADPEERDLQMDWSKAKLVIPQPKKHINLRVDADVLEWFKAQGRGHLTRMNAVLRAYMDAHR